MNSNILKNLRKGKSILTRPAILRPGKKKSAFIYHNDYFIVEETSKEKGLQLVKKK